MVRRRSTGSAKKSGGGGTQRGGLAKKGAAKVKEALPPKTNREVMEQKLNGLAAPVLEKYGMPAFDELMTRLETTIEEFNAEVSTLFADLVTQSREDHARMKSMLSPEDGGEEENGGKKEEVLGDVENMSEVEKRLEMRDREAESKSSGT